MTKNFSSRLSPTTIQLQITLQPLRQAFLGKTWNPTDLDHHYRCYYIHLTCHHSQISLPYSQLTQSDAMAAINRRLTDITELTTSSNSSSGSSLHSRSSLESLGAPSDTTAPSIHEDDARRADDPTAIVGLACRLPGAQSSSKLWENILEQKDLQSKIPADRFNVDEFYHPNGANKGTARLSSSTLSYVANEL